jgi:CAAX prenyl protease-like protein
MSKRPGLARTIPFGLYIGLMILQPYLEALLPGGMDGRWLYGVRVGIVLIALIALWRYFEELREAPNPGAYGSFLGIGIGLAVFLLWIQLDFKPLAFAPGEGFDPGSGDGLNMGLVLVRLAGAALIVPVMEELFWRSFLLRWIQRPSFLSVDATTLGFKAILFSSVLFASEHRLWFAGLLAGLAYAWLYRKTGNLWVPVLAHAVTNGLLGAYVLFTGSWSLW